jgi:recombination protein RecT
MTNNLITKEKEFLSNIESELNTRLLSEMTALGTAFNSQRFLMNSIEAVQQLKLSDKPVSPIQVANGLMKGAYLNLDFSQKECYLIYYKDRGLTFQTDYKGEVKLAKQHSVKPVFEIYAEVVRKGDKYQKVTIQSQRYINHEPLRFNDGEIEGAYAVVKYKDGSTDMVEISVKDIEIIRKTYSKAPNSGAWTNRYVEMCKKTALRLLCKNIQLDFSREQYEAYQEGGDCEFDKPTYTTGETAINPFETVTPIVETQSTEPQSVEEEVVDTPATSSEEAVEAPENELICSQCGVTISDRVHKYSLEKYGKALCYNCQKKVG